MANQESGGKRDQNKVSADTSSPKRQMKDPSLGFTKAVIICRSSELSRSEEKIYRPNNIVIELLKKNPKRYGKVVFARFATEEQVREELCARFTILRNKKLSFASADQYGKLNFHESEKWSGKNVRRWLPGSSAMYLILEGGDEDNEPPNLPIYSNTSSNPSSGLSYTTMRTSPTNGTIMSWQSNRSQRALLDFLSSPERALIDQSARRKTFAMATCSRAKTCGLPRSHSYPNFTDVDSRSPSKIHTVNSELQLHRNNKPFISSKTTHQTTQENDSPMTTFIHKRGIVKKESTSICDPHSNNSTENDTKSIEHAQNNGGFHAAHSRSANQNNTSGQVAVQSAKTNDTQITESNQDARINDFKKLQLNRAAEWPAVKRSFDQFDSVCQQRIASRSSLGEHRKLTRRELIRDTIQHFVQSTVNHSTNPHNFTHSHHSKKRRLDHTTERHHGCCSLSEGDQDGDKCSPTRETSNQNSQELESSSSEVKKKEESKHGQITENSSNEYCERFRMIGEKHKSTPDNFTEPVEVTNDETQNGSLDSSASGTKILTDIDVPSCFVPCYMVPSPFYNGHFYRPMTPFTPAFCVPRDSGVTWKDLHDSFRSGHVMYEGNMIVPASRDLPYKGVFSGVETEESRMDVDENTADQSSEESTEVYYENEIIPDKGTCKGGETFVVLFKHPLHGADFSVCFDDKRAVDLSMDNPYVLKGKTPDSSEAGPVVVTITTKSGKIIGQTSFIYIDDVTQSSPRGTVSPAMTSSSEEEKHKVLDDRITVVTHAESPVDHVTTDNIGNDPGTDISHRDQTTHASTTAETTTNKIGLKEADNLILLSSIASKIKHHTSTTSTHTAPNHSKHMQTKQTHSQKEPQSSGFHKKVFVLPANSLYLPSQSDLCKLRMTGNCYSKIFFHASMSEDDVIAQIRTTFPDLGDSRLRLAIVDQTGRLVFHDEIWSGRTIRKKLRGNSVLYVAPYLQHKDVIE